jgi:N-acyl homoserine lactone hydrolase
LRQHVIKPLMLAHVPGDKGVFTYLSYSGHPMELPYVMWYIRSGNTHVLVDTAIEAEDYRNLHPGFRSRPFESVQTFEEALAKVGCLPDDIDIVIQTHLHMDHVYNTPKCRNAVVYVQEKELEFALDPHPIFSVSYPKEVIRGIDFTLIRGSRSILPGIDVMPVPGHTPGVQAVIVATKKGRAVITGCCTIMENFTSSEDTRNTISPYATHPVIAPGLHSDLFQAYRSMKKILRIADIIIPMHDPDMARQEQIPS